MLNIFDDNDDAKTLSTDMVLASLGVFLMLLVVVLFWLNPPGEADKAEDEPPGNLIVEVRWPDGMDVDIDTWGMAPKETRPIGYSNMNGVTLNLLRDDLGIDYHSSKKDFNQPMEDENHVNSFDILNYENMYSRGLPPGEYIFNLHFYADYRSRSERSKCVPVDVEISKRDLDKKGLQRLVTTTVELCNKGQETTVIAFIIDENGKFDRESVHSLPTPLRNWIE